MSDLFEAPVTNQEPNEDTDYLANLVGDGKKFKTTQDLARGKAESDAFIARLQAEQTELRNELAQRARLAELIDKMEKPQTPPPQKPEDTPQTQENQGIDPSKLNEIVNGLLNQRESNKTATQNIETVKQTLTDKFGAAYVEKLKAQASQLGVSTEFLETVAKQSPKAFYNLIGLDSAPSKDGFTPPEGQRRSFEPATKGRDKKFYDNIRKTNITDYWSHKVQNQMHADAQKMGADFFK